MRLHLFTFLFLVSRVNGASEQTRLLNAKCRDLLSCSINKGCVNVEKLALAFDKQPISKQLYDDLDKHIEYGKFNTQKTDSGGYTRRHSPLGDLLRTRNYRCIFTSGCQEECNRCPLCKTGKEQLVDILSGSRRENNGECSTLVNCAADCIEKSNGELPKINFCLRHKCAFHCFDGSCVKCSAFITRVFNQVCVAADFRSRILNWNGHCYEMFRDIVAHKFADEFKATGRHPSIGIRQ